MAARAKNKKKTLKDISSAASGSISTILQKRPPYGPLPKLLKWFGSAEQNGRQNEK